MDTYVGMAIALSLGLTLLYGLALEAKEWVLFGIASFVLMAATILLVATTYEGAYKLGQVEALTGTVNYELVTAADSTRSWEKK